MLHTTNTVVTLRQLDPGVIGSKLGVA